MTVAVSKASVLVVDDDPSMRSALRRALRPLDRTVSMAGDGRSALDVLGDRPVDGPGVAIVDLCMPGMDGIEVLAEIKRRSPHTEVLILTGRGTIGDAVRAMRSGASDFVEKPFDAAQLRDKVCAAARIWEARQVADQSDLASVDDVSPVGLIGASDPIRLLRDMAGHLGASDALVLIQGESGTGKERFAFEVHRRSPRVEEPFTPVDTSAMSPSVIESELFGHAKGAFTGAHSAREGLLRAAGGGTVFLDEIGDLPLALQTRLLRVLQEKSFRAVGSDEWQRLDARVIAATHKDLALAVTRGEFREDLYHRLNVVTVSIPPLRDHKDDLPSLVEHFVRRFRSERPALRGISAEAMKVLRGYDWPGNVRELENAVLRALVMGSGEQIDVADLPLHILEAAPVTSREGGADGSERGREDVGSGTLAACERAAIVAALKQSGGRRREAASILNIGTATLYRKIRKYRID